MAVATTALPAGVIVAVVPPRGGRRFKLSQHQEMPMIWTTPAAQDLRFGFEITMYISAR